MSPQSSFQIPQIFTQMSRNDILSKGRGKQTEGKGARNKRSE